MKLRALAVVLTIVSSFSIGKYGETSCLYRFNRTIATVCDNWGCESTVYWDVYLECQLDGGASTSWFIPPGGITPPTLSPFDLNRNGVVDSWRDVVETSDHCADNFDTGDRLGINHGGPNDLPGRKSHSGVDLQADRNDPIFSMMTGEVVAVSSDTTCGSYVTIRHYVDDSRASYCHMVTGSQTVGVGDVVRAGDIIGRVNSTGNSSGDHLHITFRDSGGAKREYFNYTDTAPTYSQLDPGGC